MSSSMSSNVQFSVVDRVVFEGLLWSVNFTPTSADGDLVPASWQSDRPAGTEEAASSWHGDDARLESRGLEEMRSMTSGAMLGFPCRKQGRRMRFEKETI